MKNLILTISLIFIISVAHSQISRIGVGTQTPDPSSIVDIVSTTQGVLFPRMTNHSIQAITSPVRGIQVYSLDDHCIHIYNNKTWNKNCPLDYSSSSVRPIDPPGTMNPLNYTQYVNADLNAAWIIDHDTDSMNEIISNPSVTNTVLSFNESNTMHSVDLNPLFDENIKTGQSELYLEDDELRLSWEGVDRFAFLANQIVSNRATRRIEFPNNAENIAIGEFSLINQNPSFGSSNKAIGNNALRNNLIGEKNIAIGQGALNNNTIGSFNIAIGNEAGYFETGSNTLYIEGSNADQDNALIYGEFDNDILKLNAETTIKEKVFAKKGAYFGQDDGALPFTEKGVRVFFNQGNIGSIFSYDYGLDQAENLRLQQTGGFVGIGVLPTEILHVRGGAKCVGGTTWMNGSDRRLKKNFYALQYGLKEILALKPVHYKWKDSDRKDIGFIAQDVREIIPEIVSGKEGKIEDGYNLGVSYGNLNAALVKATQEQTETIRQQKIEIEKQSNINSEQKEILLEQEERIRSLEVAFESLLKEGMLDVVGSSLK